MKEFCAKLQRIRPDGVEGRLSRRVDAHDQRESEPMSEMFTDSLLTVDWDPVDAD